MEPTFKRSQIAEELKFIPKQPEINKLQLFFLKEIPLVFTFIESLEKAGLTTDMLVAFHARSVSAAKAVPVFKIASVALSGLDFILLPLAYIACRAAGQPFKVTLSRAAKAGYAGVVLGLGILSLLVPSLGLAIGAVSLILAIGATAASLTHLFYKAKRNKHALLAINNKINIEKNNLYTLIENAENTNADADISKIYTKISNIQELFDKRQKFLLEKQFLGNSAYLDKSLGLILTTVGLVGLGLIALSPPVGLTILAVASITGLGYVGVRAVQAIFKQIKYRKRQTAQLSQHNPSLDKLEPNSAAIQRDKELFEAAEHALNNIKHNSVPDSYIVDFLGELSKIIKKSDPRYVFDILKELDFGPPILQKIYQTLDNVKDNPSMITEEQLALLKTCPPIATYLNKPKSVDIPEPDTFLRNLVEPPRPH